MSSLLLMNQLRTKDNVSVLPRDVNNKNFFHHRNTHDESDSSVEREFFPDNTLSASPNGFTNEFVKVRTAWEQHLVLMCNEHSPVSLPGSVDWPTSDNYCLSDRGYLDDLARLVTPEPNVLSHISHPEFELGISRHSRNLGQIKWEESIDARFLFVRYHNADELRDRLGNAVQDIGESGRPGVFAVLFKSHEIAKRAFVNQKEYGIRMVPHTCSKRRWYQNPKPKCPVKFKTTRRVTVRKGKSMSKERVGDFLMVDARTDRGCTIWADQLKGHRLRVVAYIGKFLNKDDVIEEVHNPPSLDKANVIGWISTVCNKTKKKFVERVSGQIEDYIFDEDTS